jgi:hypothetical protein
MNDCLKEKIYRSPIIVNVTIDFSVIMMKHVDNAVDLKEYFSSTHVANIGRFSISPYILISRRLDTRL